ncbi:hypothetical protein [Lysinibacillus xylanilyticus]|uniref:Uncharacterized protein n=1 Tax=Lysinibacillus xylanilyticus TaxID=582475 RepID=A0ABT4EV35_9BACI|nr:hypothetical protein [Lysinibacillus xylanilyticus]MCY9549398.1 hypothetical protein [Lysinibacillus xylanilyticus]
MNIDFKKLEKELAEQKVYDAWQYVKSLQETLGYMSMSYNLLNKIYEHRKSILESTKNEIFQTALEKGNASITQDELNRTNLDIAGYQIDDVAFLKKTIIEFFHYARVSMDVLFQIINAGLLGDKAYPVADKGLLGKVLTEINKIQDFANLKQQLSQVNNNDEYNYLRAFDNYIKHIKTILVTVKNSFMIGKVDEFYINEFFYDNVFYEQVDALVKVKEIYDYVINTVDEILKEVHSQVPNCLDNSQRIQEIKFNMQVQKNESGDKIDFITFYIEVENDLSELPNEIKVYPLIIKPNDEIHSFDFRFDKLFVKKRNVNNDEDSIVGYAELKNGLETNEFYRVFEVKTGSYSDFIKYLSEFKNRNQTISMNLHAMEGQIIAYDNK